MIGRLSVRALTEGSPKSLSQKATALLNFTGADFPTSLVWSPYSLLLTHMPAAAAVDSQARQAEANSETLAAESMRRVEAELVWAASVLVQSGFVEPPGATEILPEPLAHLSWNIAYNDAAARWIAGDPEWKEIGGAARCAADLLNAGVAIQIAAMGVRDGRAPITAAVALHNMSVVFGAMRVHLRQWLDGEPQKLAAQRARAANLKAADWYTPVKAMIQEGLEAGDKIDAIAAGALAALGKISATSSNLPSHDAVRMKIQRLRRERRK